MSGTCLMQYVMIVANSWLVDFQPQGRYLLPILLFISYLIFPIDQVWEDRVLRVDSRLHQPIVPVCLLACGHSEFGAGSGDSSLISK